MAHSNVIPIPRWDKGWKPTDYLGNETNWPENFDPSTLPRPKYLPGDIIRFRWSNNTIAEGVVHEVKLHGGRYYDYEGDVEEICRQRYKADNMCYTVYWRGHSRWIFNESIENGE